MKYPFLKHLGCLLFAAVVLAFPAKAQVPAPEGGFKNPYLTVNKSGKVVLTYSRWEEQVKKGNYTLVTFWASWSEDFQEDAPFIKSARQKYAGKGLKVLGVPYGDEISDTMDAMVAWGVDYPQLVDVDDDLAGPFELENLPLIVLLGPDGKTVARDLRGDGILEALEAVF